jgi:hypothetical protein
MSLDIVAPSPATEAEPSVATEDAIVCAGCSRAITRAEARVARGGSHVHTRLNPHGWVWEFGCFLEAPGCRVTGEPTEEHTWFAGQAWRIADCAGCGVHLGWRFDGADGSFFGLILERLRGT